MNTPTLRRETLPTPIGELVLITAPDGALCSLDWDHNAERTRKLLARHFGAAVQVEHSDAGPTAAAKALGAYFDGDIHAIDALPTVRFGTPFQRAVWDALRTIPTGTTATYGRIAAQIGHPTAVRAVGLANGANPVAIVVPCHRVIGSDGSLTGYASGIERKRWLLSHEAPRL